MPFFDEEEFIEELEEATQNPQDLIERLSEISSEEAEFLAVIIKLGIAIKRSNL